MSLAVSTVCVAVGTVIAVSLGYSSDSVTAVALAYFSAWAIFALTYSLLTWRILRRADAATLARWLQETPAQQRRRRMSQIFLGTGSTPGAMTLASAALGAVVVVVLLPTLRENPIVVILAVAVVTASWIMLVTVLAVRYASEDPKRGNLRFPNSEYDAPVFSDFWYIAVQVVTTFSTSDVAVTSTRMRREIAGHSIIAFTFNTVIVALLVSLLVSASG